MLNYAATLAQLDPRVQLDSKQAKCGEEGVCSNHFMTADIDDSIMWKHIHTFRLKIKISHLCDV